MRWGFLLLNLIAYVLFLILKMRVWLIREVGTAWTDEETSYNYKRLLGPEQSKLLTVARTSPGGVYACQISLPEKQPGFISCLFVCLFFYRNQMPMDVAHSRTRVLVPLLCFP